MLATVTSLFPCNLRGPGDSKIGLKLVLEYLDPGKFHTRTMYFEVNPSDTEYLVLFKLMKKRKSKISV